MTTGKTIKELIAKGWKLELIPVQHMFPNCQVKYKTNCKDMKSCDKEVEEIKITFPAKYGDYTLLTQATIKKEKEKLKPPKGFEADIEKARKIKLDLDIS